METINYINNSAPTFTYPSHPPLPEGIQTKGIDLAQDPRGWTYIPSVVEDFDDVDVLEPLFPDVGLWSCVTIGTENAPAETLQTALYLTVTSISTEAGGPATVSAMQSTSYLAVKTTTLAQHTTSQPISLPPVILASPLDIGLTASTDARGNVAVPADSSAAPPLSSSSTNPMTEIPLSTSVDRAFFPLPSSSAKLLPMVTSSTIAQGSIIFSRGTVVDSPVLVTSTNVQDQVAVLPGVSTEDMTASAPTVSSYAIEQGMTTSSASYSQAVTLPATNVQISRIITTLPARPKIDFITSPDPITTLALLTSILGSQTVSANEFNGNVVGSQTQEPGGSVIASGTTMLLSPGGKAAVTEMSTERLASRLHSTLPAPLALVTGSQIIVGSSQDQFFIKAQTLTPGGVMEVSGTPIFLASKEVFAVIGTRSQTLALTSLPPLTIDNQTIIADTLSQYVVDNQTLTPGGVISVSGTRVALAPGKTEGLAGLITEALGRVGGNGSVTGSVTYTSAARQCWVELIWLSQAVILGSLGVVIWL